MGLELVAEDLTVNRGGRQVLDAVSFTAGAGEALLITGPNGAGKTTLLRTIAGFLQQSAGKVLLAGGDPELAIAEHCHYAGHLDAVKSRLTVAENLAFWCRYLDGPDNGPRSAMASLALADLAHVSAAYLSAGQRRRLGLARLLVAPRPIWLLDEPTVSLDRDSTTAFAALVERHCAGGGIVLAATHVDLGVRSTRTLRLSPHGMAT